MILDLAYTALVLVVIYAFAFWRGRKYQRNVEASRRPGFVQVPVVPLTQ